MHWHVEEPDMPDLIVAEAVDAPPRTRSPLLIVIRDHWRTVLLAGGAFVANNVCFYIAITYVIAYGTATVGVAREVLLFAVMASSVLMIPWLVGCGALSDRFGRRGIFMIGAILSGLWAFALFPLIETGAPANILIAICVMMLFISMMYGPQAALFAELFPRHLRYSGASLGYQIGSVFGGGFAPIIATGLYARYASSTPIALYLAAACAVSLLSIILLGRPRGAYDSEAY
jgi:MFS family permease